MVLIRSANLEDTRHPLVVRFFAVTFVIIWGLLVLDGWLVGHTDEAFSVVLDAINCQELIIKPCHFGLHFC